MRKSSGPWGLGVGWEETEKSAELWWAPWGFLASGSAGGGRKKKEILQRFREIVKNHGGIHCRDIAGVDWKDRDQAKAFYKSEKIVECRRIVGEAAYMIGELLERESQKP